jgi:hypothetical protein
MNYVALCVKVTENQALLQKLCEIILGFCFDGNSEIEQDYFREVLSLIRM